MAPPKPLVPGCARRGGVRQTAEGVLPSRGLGEKLRSAKDEIERVLASGGDLDHVTKALDRSNEAYKAASIPIRKHTTIPKAKAKSAATAPLGLFVELLEVHLANKSWQFISNFQLPQHEHPICSSQLRSTT